MHKKIAIVLGTRPEAIKLIPIYIELKKRNVEVQLISTGQHQSMLQQIFSFFEVKPDVSLNVMVHNQSLSGLTAKLTEALQLSFENGKYDLVMVQGDTTTAMVSSLVAFYNKIQVAHIEAGLRTYQKFSPYPEEVNRQIIGRIADLHFAPTPLAEEVLKNEKAENVYMVGNTVIDSLLLCLAKVRQADHQYEEKFSLINRYERVVLITGHRRENFGEGFIQICNAIKTLSTRFPSTLFYYPVHLNPNVLEKVNSVLSGIPNIFLGEPLPYDELVYIMSKSFIILTDSGGIQEEAPSLNVPVLVMRDTTERPEGVTNGCAILVGTDEKCIVDTFTDLEAHSELYQKMANAANPYGDGKTSRRIADILLTEI